jgi:MraZ protein
LISNYNNVKWFIVVKCGGVYRERGCMNVFMGEYQHTLDSKGRLILPSRIREGLGETFIATRGLDNCIFVYTKDELAAVEEKMRQLPLLKPEARAYVRYLFSGAAELEPDKQGRILLPTNLREHAKLEKDVVVMGVSSRVEIWSKENWQQYNERMGPTVEQLAENLIDFGI